MLNRFIALCLLTALISSGFSRFFVYAGFEVNSKYISQNPCENKSRPWMHCNGRCYLMKKLKQADEKEKKQHLEQLKSSYQEAFPNSAFQLTFKSPVFKMAWYLSLIPKTVNRSIVIFQPPKIAIQLA